MSKRADPIHWPAAKDPRWVQVVSRDRSADGHFWYSVATTGVYCRPSCPSRTANPKNVRLHATWQDARATGCRPCKRCNPDGPSPRSESAALVTRVCRLIEKSEEEPALADLAAAIGLSPSHLHRLFKKVTGLSPKAYAGAQRATKVRRLLQGSGSVTEAVYDSGFRSSGRFYETADKLLGMTPSQYRAGGVDEKLFFAVADSRLGAMLAASSSKGVAAILLGDDSDVLVRDLQDRFPKARLIGADPAYEALVASVVGSVEEPDHCYGLPLDILWTAFQQRVWQRLCAALPDRRET